MCHLHGIGVAAISPAAAELYVNPLCGLEDGEHRFVIAHELLHAGLRHDTRGGGRDPSWSSQESHEFATLAMCDLV